MNSKKKRWTVPEQSGIGSKSGLESLRVVQISQFLPKHERDALFDAVCANQEAFQQPGIPRPDTQGSLYCSLKSDGPVQPGIAVYEACECLSERILELLPTLFTTLDIEPFAVSKITPTLVNGLDGHSGTPHTDESGSRFKISLLYYFHRTPKAFRGGSLKFYESDPASPSGHNDKILGRIEHEDNLLIAFPSKTFHEITKVQCESNEFADGRFVAVGFLGPH